MDRSKVLGGIVGLLYVTGLASCVFNFDVTSCDDFPMPGCPGVTPHDGGPDADSGPPPACIPSENTQAVADSCGVFVSSSKGSDTSGKGTKVAPYATLTKALGAAKGKPVYACGEVFDKETVSISASATLFGALDCANQWKHDGTKKTQLAPTMEGIALTISKATTNAEVYDFAITSADATQDGGSSIAVLVAQASASFTSCELVAGNGKDGAAGVPYQDAAQAGGDGNKGNEACSGAFVAPGLSVTNACGDSTSGAGGIGQASGGGAGSPGSPGSTLNGGTGDSGAGCTPGTQGDDGATIGPATPGTGATGIGSISASGYAGPTSSDGSLGKPGQGGGGGGGAKGETTASACPANSGGGASGGSGGSGGCGGAGGKGGGAGGSSIALVSVDATLSFTSTTLGSGTAGNGGNGGPGQNGGNGGNGAAGGGGKGTLKAGCAGGPGGKGGGGGLGGGGLGGHSLGLAITGKAPPQTGWTATPKAGGTGGTGDNTGGNKGDGANGLGCKSLNFGNPSSCVQ